MLSQQCGEHGCQNYDVLIIHAHYFDKRGHTCCEHKDGEHAHHYGKSDQHGVGMIIMRVGMIIGVIM